jgi:hypothetical protein
MEEVLLAVRREADNVGLAAGKALRGANGDSSVAACPTAPDTMPRKDFRRGSFQ